MEGVHDLRTVADCERIRAEIGPGRKAVVGMGFIGSEVAASLWQSGVDVVVDRNKMPLRRVLGEEVGRVIEGIHCDHEARGEVTIWGANNPYPGVEMHASWQQGSM